MTCKYRNGGTVTRQTATRRRCNYDAPSIALVKRYENDTTYDLYTWRAGLVLAAMFVLLGLGSVMFGW